MKFTQIKETCIYTTDLVSARKFYHDLLGLSIIGEVENKHVFFKAGTSVLLCFNPEDSRLKKSPPSHFAEGKYHFAFEVSDENYENHKQQIVEKGIPIIDILIWKSGKESFYFNDPIGNVVEIVPEGIWD